jgi:ribosomal protein L24
VKVTEGVDAGKSGVILRLEPKVAEVWTDNSNAIRVSKKCL